MRMEIQQRDPSLEEVSVIFLIGVAVINGEAHGFRNLTEVEKRAELHFSFLYRKERSTILLKYGFMSTFLSMHCWWRNVPACFSFSHGSYPQLCSCWPMMLAYVVSVLCYASKQAFSVQLPPSLSHTLTNHVG